MARSYPGSTIPTINDLMNPVLHSLRELGGSATNAELVQAVIERMKLSPDVADIPHLNGPESEVDYRVGWAKTNLKKQGLIDNSRRGVWSLTQRGRSTDEVDAQAVSRNVWQTSAQRDEKGQGGLSKAPASLEDDSDDSVWQEVLLNALGAMDPSAFERFCGRLLRESGFERVVVTGRPGDGGIDGQGVIKLAGGMIGFPVYFQCKRYSGNVPAGAVRDFRGAMQGRGDKGLIITTGSFTLEAKREATRAGALPIDLIDGVKLADKIKELELGVSVDKRIVEDVTVDAEWFNSF